MVSIPLPAPSSSATPTKYIHAMNDPIAVAATIEPLAPGVALPVGDVAGPSAPGESPRTRLGPAVALTFALVFWSSAFAAIRFVLHSYAPAHLALFRYFVASVALAAYAL